jgi:hypothetical protein
MEKDLVVAMLGAAATIAGFLLVFLAVVIGTAQSFGGDAPSVVVGRFRTAAVWILAGFGVSLASVVLSTVWLLLAGCQTLYWPTVGMFVLQTVSAFGVAVWTTFGVLLRE